MKVEIQSKKFIKPFTPTPPNKRSHNLSFIDEIAPKMYVPIILYYQPPHNIINKHLFSSSTCLYHLETSLSKTLVQFYPLAGRYNKHLHVVDCNDEGVEFIEANIDSHLHEILPQQQEISDAQLLSNFIPNQILTVDEATHPLLYVQVNRFKCGSFALGICISHRIADAATLCMFIQAWAANTNSKKNENQEILPSLNSAIYLPKRGLPHELKFESAVGCNFLTRRFSFDNKAISTLRTTLQPYNNTSKLQFVIAVIWKALLGVEKLKDEHSRATLIVQPVNLRERNITPFLPKNCCGNLCMLAWVEMMAGENLEIQDLANQLSNSVKDSIVQWAKITSLSEDDPFLKSMINNMRKYYMISSWSKFPFYECDFGWGKPVWISSVKSPCKNMIVVMDDKKGGGYEAWVSLEENDMIIFEQDPNIKAFTGHFAHHLQ